MPALEEFADHVAATGPLYLNGPEEIVNDAALRNYEMGDLTARSKREVQGGSVIKTNLILDSSEDAVHYHPGEVATITNPSYLSTPEIPWRFTRIPVSWNEKEIDLNDGASREARFQQYTRIMLAKLMGRETDILTKIEKSLVAPATTDMETTSGKTPYSVFSLVTADGLAAAGSTVEGINPTTASNWRNQVASYTAASLYDPDNGLVAGMDEMSELVRFKAPQRNSKYFTESGLDQMVIITNKEGRNNMRKVQRSLNDITRIGAQDPAYPDPTFNGVPIRAVEALDESNRFTAGKPDYLFINAKYLHIVCRAGRWFKMSKEMRPHNQPDSVVFYLDCWWNLVGTSRKRQGYLSAA